MKKILIASLALALSFGALAQTGSDSTKSKKKPENFVMMYKGKMMKVVDGKPSPLTEPVKLNNGAQVNVDGSVNLPNGKSIKIKENQQVTMSGKMSMHKN